jgi:two-component system OmpR family sensor kinase
VNAISQAWERISLRTKLTTLSVAIIGALLLVSSLGTIALLRTYLQQNLDTMLSSTASTLQHEDPAMLEERLATRQVQLPRLPSDYYIAYLDTKGNLMIGLVSSTRSNQDVPNLSGFSSSYVLATHGMPFESVSTASNGGTKSWRIVAVPLTSLPGSLVVALPTSNNDQLLDEYRSIGLGFGALLLTISALAVWMTITSALRPLREVERTAKAVSEGDISQRLIQHEGQTEMAKLNSSLNTMLNSIETAMQSRNATLAQMRRFVADASHELRTPLVSVRGYAELYRLGALSKKADIAEAMERIESEAIRMSALVESLLTLARLDENAQIKKLPVELFELAKIAAKDASVADGNRTIVITNLAGTPLETGTEIMAEGDGPQLRQVLTNLLANACRFSPEGAAVEIAIGKQDNNTVLEVRDHGEGIPKELRQKVFERFFRADNSRNRDTGGSGLGLAIVSTIVAQHGGTIEALETPGGGATFRVTLPN